MTFSKPIDLGKVSEKTKEMGPGPADNPVMPLGLPDA